MRLLIRCIGLASLVTAAAVPPAAAWDYEGHRAVNRIALASLPEEFPDFVRAPAAAERIAWLSGEADRWRSAPDLPARHLNAPDHYLDLEYLALAGLDPATVSSFRYEFAAEFARGRAAHPENFEPVDPAKDADRTRAWPGFLPWTIAEYFGKLRGSFARLRVLRELGSPEEVAQAEASTIELMGIMGHFVGDAAQPLHTTRHHNGWVGDNPHGYTTWKGFHSWIDSGFINAARLDLGPLAERALPAGLLPLAPRADGRDPVFHQVMAYLQTQHALVEPLYQLDQARKLRVEKDTPPSAEGVALIERQLLAAGHMLGSLWLTAWREAAPDPFLRSQLTRARAAATP